MKEIQRRAEYVCRALYFFGKDFCCLWTYAVYKVTVFQERLGVLAAFLIKPPEHPRADRVRPHFFRVR